MKSLYDVTITTLPCVLEVCPFYPNFGKWDGIFFSSWIFSCEVTTTQHSIYSSFYQALSSFRFEYRFHSQTHQSLSTLLFVAFLERPLFTNEFCKNHFLNGVLLATFLSVISCFFNGFNDKKQVQLITKPFES